MPGLNKFVILKDSDGAEINGVAKTATFNSEWLKIGVWRQFGILLKTASVTGTSPTLVVKVQCSPDGGTTAYDTYPGALNVETQAALGSINTATETMENWPNWFPQLGAGTLDPRIRFVFTIGGTNPSYTLTAHVTAVDADEGHTI